MMQDFEWQKSRLASFLNELQSGQGDNVITWVLIVHLFEHICSIFNAMPLGVPYQFRAGYTLLRSASTIEALMMQHGL